MPRVRLHSRQGEYLEVLVDDGYIEIQRRVGGKLYGVITLPRDKAVVLLKWLIPQVKGMTASVDPLAQMAIYAEEDNIMRQERRERRRSPRRRKRS